jgi:hypothetical protein
MDALTLAAVIVLALIAICLLPYAASAILSLLFAVLVLVFILAVFGIVIPLLLLAALCYWLYRCWQKRKERKRDNDGCY